MYAYLHASNYSTYKVPRTFTVWRSCVKVDSRYLTVFLIVVISIYCNVLFSPFPMLEQILANVREEVKRFQRRKQLNFNQSQSHHMSSQHQDSLMCESPTSPASPASCPRSPSPGSCTRSPSPLMALASSSTQFGQSCSTKEKPLFTFKQVMCLIDSMLSGLVVLDFVELDISSVMRLGKTQCSAVGLLSLFQHMP